MGVTNGGKAMYRIKDLTRAEFTSIVRGLAKVEKMQHATIVVDVSNLMFGVSSKVKAIAEYLFEMAGSGLTICPVCDNNIRPSVKQATNKRRAQREKARSEEIVLRREVRVLRRRLHQESLTEKERSDLLGEIGQLEKKRRRKETASCAPTQTNFNEELERELDLLSAKSINDAGGSVLKVVTAECQADLYMARQIQIKQAVMVLSTDADIPTLTGDCCISINGFSQTKIELVSTSKVTLENAMSHVIREEGSKAKLVDAEQPIFENVDDRRLRAMMMLICGCDVYCPGLKGTGIATVSKHIKTFKETSDDPQNETKLFEYLLEIMKKEFKPRLKEQNHEESADEEARKVVLTYIDALVFEPTNAINEERTYLVDAPKELSQYCKDFAASDTKIIPGPTVLECKGVGGKAHPFLAADGHGTCAKCNHTVCSYCQGTLGMDTSAYCLLCAATESLVPTLGTEAPEDSVQAKRTQLQDDGFAGAKDLDSDEVEDAFEALEFIRRFRSEGMDEDNVPFPLYASNAMDDDEEMSAWEDIAEINFSQGGSFIADGTINEKLIPRVLKFFAGVTTFASPDEKHTDWKKDATIYDALPKLLIDFAGKSRADSGYRLLKRCVRHALDSKCPSLEDKTATLILHGEDIGLRIHSDIPASMRKGVVYKPGVAFTETDVLCCQCNCHCGAQDNERVVCVHNFPLIFLLLLLLMDALAENILLELAACMRSNIWDTTVWSDDEMKSMKQYVVTLAEAAGEDMTSINLEETSIVDLLEKFETGTQGRKEWKQRCKSKPKPGDHCSIVNVGKFESTATEAKKRTSRPSQKNPLPHDSLETDVPAPREEDARSDPNYIDIELLIQASGCGKVLQSNPIGWELIKMRSRKQRERLQIDTSEIISKNNKFTKDWEEAFRVARKRTYRSSDTQMDNLQKRQHIDLSSNPTPTRVVTPTDELVQGLSPVTPSPPKKRIRRPGCELPSRMIPITPTEQTEQKPKKKIGIKCCKRGCKNNRRDNPAVKFHLVTSPKNPPKSSNPKKQSLINYAGAVLLRQELMDRALGPSSRNDTTRKCYICDEHIFEQVSKSTSVKLKDDKSINVTFKLVVPVGAGPKSTLSHPTTLSLGTGRDRSIRKRLEGKDDEDDEEQIDEWALCVQQMSEQVSTEKDSTPINPAVAAAANIPLKKGNASEFICDGKPFFHATPVTPTAAAKTRKTDEPPTVQPGRVSDSEVKRRTGFPNEKTMLSYVIVACNGNINTMKQRQTSLTWYEEWFMLFEYVWNRSLTRLQDVSKAYGNVDKKDILRILDAKLDICWNARENWPMFASFEEDKALQKKKWASRYDGMRPVMWDMTNISAYAFSNADWQRLTYSSYYNENCFKSGVFCQPCGWMGVVDLWTGGVSDSDFNRRAGYLQKQQRFQENDLVEMNGERKVIRFLNIYDKGYRAKMPAWQNGRQLVLQPDFKDSDKRFNRNQTISSASVASDRGGNERVVNVSKRAGLISKGFQSNADAIRFNKVWTTWSFQANFMFDKVL